MAKTKENKESKSKNMKGTRKEKVSMQENNTNSTKKSSKTAREGKDIKDEIDLEEMELDKEQEAQKLEEQRMQEQIAKFEEKCKGLLMLAKKKKNVLDYQEIMAYFLDTDFEADKMEKVFEFLEVNNVDVKMSEDEVDEDDIILDAEEIKSKWKKLTFLFQMVLDLKTLLECI